MDGSGSGSSSLTSNACLVAVYGRRLRACGRYQRSAQPWFQGGGAGPTSTVEDMATRVGFIDLQASEHPEKHPQAAGRGIRLKAVQTWHGACQPDQAEPRCPRNWLLTNLHTDTGNGGGGSGELA